MFQKREGRGKSDVHYKNEEPWMDYLQLCGGGGLWKTGLT